MRLKCPYWQDPLCFPRPVLLPRSLLSLVPSGLTVDRLLPTPDRILLIARSRSTSAACPLCGGTSSRVHSFYSRRLADLPWQGRVVELQVRVRRFRCTSLQCRRCIFAERLDIARPKARRTVRLRDIQQQIGLALGGEAGSRLVGRAGGAVETGGPAGDPGQGRYPAAAGPHERHRRLATAAYPRRG